MKKSNIMCNYLLRGQVTESKSRITHLCFSTMLIQDVQSLMLQGQISEMLLFIQDHDAILWTALLGLSTLY